MAVGKVLLAALLLWMPQARAHEGEQWIAEKSLSDPVSKQFCCGPLDCHQLKDGDVAEVSGGYRVFIDELHDAVFVPYARALPVAPDGHFHACITWRYNERGAITDERTLRCFIAPPGQM